MIIPDINLLLYTYDAASPFHAKARAWWQKCLSGADMVGIPLPVVFGFVRIATNPRVFRSPMSVAEVSGHVRSWLATSAVQVLIPGVGHLEDVLKQLEHLGAAGNLVTDTQIAAMALEHEATLHTADTDFIRFPGLRWLNPLTGIGSHSLRKSGESK